MHKRVKLDNGIPVVMEITQDVHSVCIGVWVKTGSRNEQPEDNGISHFLEHMFFKGTEKRTAKDIAMEIDSIGGELNAFTSSENTTFYVKVLDEYLEKAVDLLSDIFLHSTFPEVDIEKEKSIITEEIKMVEDTPSDYIHELFCKNIWGEKGLGQPVLGKGETIERFTREDLLNRVSRCYGTDSVVIACSGNLEEEKVIGLLNQGFGRLKRASMQEADPTPEFRSSLDIVPKDLSESHICLGLKGLPYGSDDRYAMHLLNTILGGGMSSRLFQEIREKRGLAYSIGSYNASYSDTGFWAVYAGTDRRHVREVVHIVMDEIRNLPYSVTEEELRKAKDQLKGSLLLALESTTNKMTNIARQEIYYGRYYPPEEVIRLVESVTLEDLKRLSQVLTDGKSFALTVYGPVDKEDFKDLSC